MQMMIQKLQAQINKYMAQNSRLRDKYSHKSRSRKSPSKKQEDVYSLSNSNPKKHNMNSPNPKEMFKSEVKYLANSAISMISGSDDIKVQQQNFTKQILILKMEIKRKQKEVSDIRKELDDFLNSDKKIEDEFGKTLTQIIEEYRQYAGRRTLQQSKSVKYLQKTEEERNIVRSGRDSLKKEQPKRVSQHQFK